MKSRHCLFWLLASATLAFTTNAEPEKPKIISARLHCLSVDESISGLSLLADKDKKIPIVVPNGFLSPPYDYVGPAEIMVLDEHREGAQPAPLVPPKTADNPSRYPNEVARVNLPPTGGEFLLLFTTTGPNSIRIAPVDFSINAVPSGNYLVYNISSHRLAFSFGEAKRIIEAGEKCLVAPLTGDDSYVPLRVYDEYKGKPRLIVSGRHFNRANARQIFFFTSDDKPNTPVKIQVFTSLIPQSPTPEK